MNIQTLYDFSNHFEKLIIESGFKRDLQDFISSLSNNQNNILALRDIADRVYDKLFVIQQGDLPDDLINLFPNSQVSPFTEYDYLDRLKSIIENKEIAQNQFFAQLQQILTQLNQKIQENIAEVKRIQSFIQPYILTEEVRLTEEEKAIISIIFKDEKTIHNLKEFTKNLQAWNRMLLIYHQIISSSAPEDIEILEIQNGSIDLVINLNIDVALNLADLFQIGFKCYAGYLGYKKIIKPITDAYFGNSKLLKLENEREIELLNNIYIAVYNKAEEQHKLALDKDKKIDKNVSKKIEQVTNLVTSHIVKGNDIKLLAMPEDEVPSNKEDILKKKDELQKVSLEVRAKLKEMTSDELIKLIKMYGEIKEDNSEPHAKVNGEHKIKKITKKA